MILKYNKIIIHACKTCFFLNYLLFDTLQTKCWDFDIILMKNVWTKVN